MGKTYEKAQERDLKVVDDVMTRKYQDLASHGLKVGFLFVYGVESDEGVKPPLTKDGVALAATIRNLTLKDRLAKGYDVEIVADGDHWAEIPDKRKEALIYHELGHLKIKRKAVKNKKTKEITEEVVYDDLMRPCLKMLRHDLNFGGFRHVMEEYGEDSEEFQLFQQVAQRVKDLVKKN